MRYVSTLIVVADLEKSKQFYLKVLGLKVILDFGANVTLTSGVSLQTKESWMSFINKQGSDIIFGANAAELYFEEDDFDGFIAKLNQIEGICYVHPILTHSWGQRVVRIYDPDKHIIEVGENMVVVVRRFLKSGMSAEETAIRMDVPINYVKSCMED